MTLCHRMTGLSRVVALVAGLMFSMPLASGSALADGVSYAQTPSQWSLLPEDGQFAMITFDGDREILMLQASVAADRVQDALEMVWLFPVPASPENSTLLQIPGLSPLQGYYLDDLARQKARRDLALVYSTQLWTIPLALSTVVYMGAPGGTLQKSLASNGDLNVNPGIEIFERVEQHGVVTELVSAASASALSAYLEGYDISLPSGSLDKIQEYVSEDYCFVSSRVSNATSFVTENRVRNGFSQSVYTFSVFVGFQTDRIFYPMKLTSAYGPQKVPIVLEILDFVHIHSSMSSLDVRYCIAKPYAVRDSSVRAFFAEQIDRDGITEDGTLDHLEFTLVTMEPSGYEMTEDLWFDDSSSAKTLGVASYVYRWSWTLVFPMFFAISAFASFASGSIVYRAYRPKRLKFAALGLANVTTILGIWLIARAVRIEETYVQPKEGQPILYLRSYLILFSILFIGLSVVWNFALESIIL